MAPITRRWLVLAGSLAPASLAGAQEIQFTDLSAHDRAFQSAVLWDVNNDGKKELVIGGSHEVPAAVYDPDHISDGPLNMSFQFMDSAFGAAATPSGRLFKVGQSPIISLYNSFTTAGANLDNGTSTGLAFFEGTPWGDVAIVSGLRNNVPYLVAVNFNTERELFAIPIVVGFRPGDLFGLVRNGEYLLLCPDLGNNIYTLSLGTDLSAPVQKVVNIQEYSEMSGYLTGIVISDGRMYATNESFVGSALLPTCPADIDHNGFVNGDDYDAFASAFESAHPSADFNADGFVNGDDYDAFASSFESGC